MNRVAKRIPTPQVGVVDLKEYLGYHTENWCQPSTYIRYRECDADEVNNYDADREDRVWLERYNASRPKEEHLTLDVLEAVIDRLEKMRGFSASSLPPPPNGRLTRLLLTPNAPPPKTQHLNDLYLWWKKRLYCRVKPVYALGKPLIPRFEVRPDPSDIQQPFHHRDIEKNTNFLRNVPRVKLADTLQSFRDLRKQREMLDKARSVLLLIKKRERLKRDYFQVLDPCFTISCVLCTSSH